MSSVRLTLSKLQLVAGPSGVTAAGNASSLCASAEKAQIGAYTRAAHAGEPRKMGADGIWDKTVDIFRSRLV